MLMPSMVNSLDSSIDDNMKKAGEKNGAFDIFVPTNQDLKYPQKKSSKRASATQDKEKRQLPLNALLIFKTEVSF